MRLVLAGLFLFMLGACTLAFPELVDPEAGDGGVEIDAAAPDAGAGEDGS